MGLDRSNVRLTCGETGLPLVALAKQVLAESIFFGSRQHFLLDVCIEGGRAASGSNARLTTSEVGFDGRVEAGIGGREQRGSSEVGVAVVRVDLCIPLEDKNYCNSLCPLRLPTLVLPNFVSLLLANGMTQALMS